MEYLRPKFPSHRSTLRSFYLRLCLSWRVLQVCLLLLCANFGVDRLTSFCLTRDQTLGVCIYSRTRSYHCCTLHSRTCSCDYYYYLIICHARCGCLFHLLRRSFQGGCLNKHGGVTPPPGWVL